jgi:hypothetical protein
MHGACMIVDVGIITMGVAAQWEIKVERVGEWSSSNS